MVSLALRTQANQRSCECEKLTQQTHSHLPLSETGLQGVAARFRDANKNISTPIGNFPKASLLCQDTERQLEEGTFPTGAQKQQASPYAWLKKHHEGKTQDNHSRAAIF